MNNKHIKINENIKMMYSTGKKGKQQIKKLNNYNLTTCVNYDVEYRKHLIIQTSDYTYSEVLFNIYIIPFLKNIVIFVI